MIVLIDSAATGSLLDLGLPHAVPWLVLATIPALAIALLPRGVDSSRSTDEPGGITTSGTPV
ncbi:hypothetical protein [Saccharothrix sp. ALI-22-I]|uniref:hypothetical protein n=1 Tax=Saccharothrix sp. ALI-22-I TaxID=1933778 RepID=UPI001930FDA3|nr:hypothetical protein [Saccharothrix sp. ALI-22-I]